VQVTVDTAELLAGLDHPGGAPVLRHLPVPPALDVAGTFAAGRDIDSMQFVERCVLATVGERLSRSTVSVSSRPSRGLPAAPGWVGSNLFRQGQQACFGLKR